MTRIACSTSWKCEPFKEGLPLPYQATFNCEQFARLKTGLIPLEMEDKWFIYYEEPYLFLHRSWTGMPVYRLTFRGISDGAEVTEALWSKEIADRVSSSSDYEVRLLDFLVSNLMLGQSKAFPMLPGYEDPPGVYQHAIAGTGYAESPPRPRKPWWRVW